MKSEAAANVTRVCELCGKSMKARQYNSHLRIHRTQELQVKNKLAPSLLI